MNFLYKNLIMYLVNSVLFFVVTLALSLIITITIATLTLVERKVLSLVQRRVGPHYVGYKGRLQFIADALKLLLKGITVPDLTNKKLFLFVPASALFISYTFWINTLWGPSLSIIEIEYNIVYLGVMSIFFGFCTMFTGIFSRNKFAVLAAVRNCVMVLNLEIFLGFIFLVLVSINESFSFSSAMSYQSNTFYTIFIFAPVLPIVIITFLLETNRTPFDLGEAESELVAGYTTELGGFFFCSLLPRRILSLIFFFVYNNTAFTGRLVLNKL